VGWGGTWEQMFDHGGVPGGGKTRLGVVSALIKKRAEGVPADSADTTSESSAEKVSPAEETTPVEAGTPEPAEAPKADIAFPPPPPVKPADSPPEYAANRPAEQTSNKPLGKLFGLR